jgi:hypothetical protein
MSLRQGRGVGANGPALFPTSAWRANTTTALPTEASSTKIKAASPKSRPGFRQARSAAAFRDRPTNRQYRAVDSQCLRGQAMQLRGAKWWSKALVNKV